MILQRSANGNGHGLQFPLFDAIPLVQFWTPHFEFEQAKQSKAAVGTACGTK